MNHKKTKSTGGAYQFRPESEILREIEEQLFQQDEPVIVHGYLEERPSEGNERIFSVMLCSLSHSRCCRSLVCKPVS